MERKSIVLQVVPIVEIVVEAYFAKKRGEVAERQRAMMLEADRLASEREKALTSLSMIQCLMESGDEME